MTTKERIIHESLTLFSTKGYAATSVKNIADAVGIKDSSLYKHFKSKKEIFDTIVQSMKDRMEMMSAGLGLPKEDDLSQAAKVFGDMAEGSLIALSRKIFLFYLKDEFISRFWRMANMEQYGSEEIYQVYHRIFMVDSITYQSRLFQEMIKEGSFISADPEVVAMNFYAPIFFLLSKYIKEPEKEEEALAVLDKQVREFTRIYKV